jgi:hypothetical protein
MEFNSIAKKIIPKHVLWKETLNRGPSSPASRTSEI